LAMAERAAKENDIPGPATLASMIGTKLSHSLAVALVHLDETVLPPVPPQGYIVASGVEADGGET
jgi:hypothetical protein